MKNNEIGVFADTGVSVLFSNQFMGYFTLMKNYQGVTFFDYLKKITLPSFVTFTDFCTTHPGCLNKESKQVASFIDLAVIRLQKKISGLPDKYSERVVLEINQNLTQLYTLIKGKNAVM